MESIEKELREIVARTGNSCNDKLIDSLIKYFKCLLDDNRDLRLDIGKHIKIICDQADEIDALERKIKEIHAANFKANETTQEGG